MTLYHRHTERVEWAW